MKKMKLTLSLTVFALFLTPILLADNSEPFPLNNESGNNPQEPRTYCRFVPERVDDFAWENDKIAFRTYGPALVDKIENSGIDCWLKRVDYPIIDKWYKSGDYHVDHGEGLDSYKVGDSRGCGGTALWINGEMVLSNVYKEWKIIKNETGESQFMLQYEYQVGNDVYTEDKVISIRLGDRLFKSTSTFTKNGKPAENLPVAIGLVLDANYEVYKDLKKGWMSAWGPNEDTELGTGVVIDPEKIDQFIIQNSGEKLKDHALIITKTDANGQVVHYAGYGWSAAKEITSAKMWNAYLAKF